MASCGVLSCAVPATVGMLAMISRNRAGGLKGVLVLAVDIAFELRGVE